MMANPKLFLLGAVVAVGGCSTNDEPVPDPNPAVLATRSPAGEVPHKTELATALVDPGAAMPQPVQGAIAVLAPTRGSATRGTVRFADKGDGVDVTADVTGLPRGPHAFHVHLFGDCSSPDGESAGDHFHFSGSSLHPAEPIITGNLGELRPEQGGARYRTHVPDAALQGTFSILGRSVVVHAKGNDPEKTPNGGAGDRIACGVIGVERSVQ